MNRNKLPLVIPLLLYLFFAFSPAKALAATGDISAVRINADGWSASVDISNFVSTSTTNNMGLGANNDPTNAKVVFHLTSPGFDSNGNVTAVSRTIYGTQIVRLPYPNQLSLDEATTSGKVTIRVALSDYVYSGDTNVTATMASGWYTDNGPGGTGLPNNATTSAPVTNNSTAPYPSVIGHFAVEQRRPVDGMSTVEVFAVQRFAQNGDPVAAVSVTAKGASSGTTVTATATSMTLSSRGDNIPVYAVNLNLSTTTGFTRGELVNINFRAYPWVGTSTLDSSINAGTQIYQLGPLEWTIMDKMIAVVDPSAGNDSTCVASTLEATASSSPCLTINGALTKIAAQNNSLYGLNRLDGGEVQLKAGTYQTGQYSNQPVTNGYFTITSHSSTNQAGVVFNGNSGSPGQYAYERFYNVTFNRASNQYLVFAANPNVLIMEKINFADAFGDWYSGDINTDVEFLDSSTTNDHFSDGGNDSHSRLNRNDTYNNPVGGSNRIIGDPSITLGLKGTGGSENIWTPISNYENNIIIAYTKWYGETDGYFATNSSFPLTNMALVNNLVERIGSSATPLEEFSSYYISNLLHWYDTYIGQRFNHENDWITPSNQTAINWSVKFNAMSSVHGDHRSDIRAQNSTIVGYWSIGYGVGWQGNHDEAISYAGDDDFWGIFGNTPAYPSTSMSPSQPAGFVSDQSHDATNLGNGNYHLTSSALPLNHVASGQGLLPYDLDGNPRRDDGTGAAGAYEYFALPTLTVQTPSSIMPTTATANGNITAIGGASPTTRGFVYGVSTAYGATTTENGSFGTGAYTASLSSLTCNTSYHIASYATNLGGTAYSSDTTFTTGSCAVTPPTVTTSAASSVATSTATFNGNITATGGANATQSGFAYSTDSTLTAGVSTSTLGAQTGITAFSQNATGLSSNSTYYVRTYATNSGGTSYGSTQSFTTNAVTLPTVTTQSVSSITTTSGTGNGNITATGGNAVTTEGFVYGLTTSYGATTTTNGSFNTGAYTGSITSLSCSTLYHVNAYGTNSAGTSYGSDTTFSTSACVITPPTVTTSAASSVATSTATFNGNITATGGANATQSGFAYSTDSTLKSGVSTSTLGAQTGIVSLSQNATGLSSNTTYYSRAYATNSGGTGYGSIQSFTTNPITVPTLTTQSASSITDTTATTNGTVTATGGNVVTTLGFVYGLTSAYGATTTTSGSFGTGAFSGSLSSLTPSTTYHFAPYAVNSAGTIYGSDTTFTSSASTTPASNTSPSNNGGFSSLGGGGGGGGGGTYKPVLQPAGSPSILTSLIDFLISIGVVPSNKASLALSFASTTTSPSTIITTTTTNTAIVPASSRDLRLGSVGTDVKALQVFLNSKDFLVSTSGNGSPGNETTYFGPATQAALARFQIYEKITPASGYFGPITRAKIQELSSSAGF